MYQRVAFRAGHVPTSPTRRFPIRTAGTSTPMLVSRAVRSSSRQPVREVEGLAGESGEKFRMREPGVARCALACPENQSPESAARMPGMGVHRPYPGRVPRGFEEVALRLPVPGSRDVLAPPAPAPAGDECAKVLRDKVGSVFDERVVERHELETCRNLLATQERTQQYTGRAFDEHFELGVVGGSGGAQAYSHVRVVIRSRCQMAEGVDSAGRFRNRGDTVDCEPAMTTAWPRSA